MALFLAPGQRERELANLFKRVDVGNLGMSLSSLYGHSNIGKLLGKYGKIMMSNWILEYHGVPMFRQTYIQEVLMHCTERGATWCTGQSLFRSCTSRGLCLKHFGDTTSASRRVKCGWEAIWSDKQWLGHRPLQLYKAENDRKSMKTILKMHVFFANDIYIHHHPSTTILLT